MLDAQYLTRQGCAASSGWMWRGQVWLCGGGSAKKEPLRAGRLLDIYRNSKGQKRNASLRRGMVRILTSWLMAL